ncbi:hypothetical protein AGMMS49938_17190 [Fibrobacterales bacterium]|nr:hypothetical protein AGMMS49938_17190 [Fibrobacterales bacterium]
MVKILGVPLQVGLFAITALSLLSLTQNLQAQITISVDENLSRNREKSLAASLALSALIPGTGHFYLGESSLGSAFFWVDASLWIAAGTTYLFQNQQLDNARGYAVKYAGATGAPRDIDFLTVVGDYRSRGGSDYQNASPDNNEDYNQAMLRAGLAIDRYYPYSEGYIWDWGSSDNPENTAHISSYKEMLKRYRLSKIAFQVTLGLMALNRVLAILDALRIYKATSAEFSHLQFVPYTMPKKSGIMVNYEF